MVSHVITAVYANKLGFLGEKYDPEEEK